MQSFTITALFGMLLAAAPALASPVENDAAVVARQTPVGTCGSQFGAPITAFPIGEACSGDGFACDPSCNDIACNEVRRGGENSLADSFAFPRSNAPTASSSSSLRAAAPSAPATTTAAPSAAKR
ncbi:hypothetical protein F5X98DRAFT_333044 [Xylaria grammica]|nr:hypothetical protein F5X98DRAFT_333044 [Xylaria grammica]